MAIFLSQQSGDSSERQNPTRRRKKRFSRGYLYAPGAVRPGTSFIVPCARGGPPPGWRPMRWRKDTDKPTDSASSDIVRTAVLASLIAALLASSVAVVSAARAIDIGPKVGDILVFHQGARMPADWEFTATTTSSTGATCTLVPLTMALEGGSLVVEQRFTTPRAFQVHWAGGRTSSQASDCGTQRRVDPARRGSPVADERGRRCRRGAQDISRVLIPRRTSVAEEAVLRPRQAEVLAQCRALVFATEDAAPL